MTTDTPSPSVHPLVVAVTGASGARYAVRLLDVLAAANRKTYLCISESGKQVLRQEMGIEVDLDNFRLTSLLPDNDANCTSIEYCHYSDFMSPIASGSHRTSGMVVCPCSGTTLSAIVHASGSNLIQRAADVHLKERRKLILVPRETPLSTVQLENMYRASQHGAVILPAMPGFYHDASSIDHLIDFVVARILDQLEIEHRLTSRWGESES